MSNETPFHLQGNFAPVQDELTETDLKVEGALPPELNGLYVRNGANPITGKSEHWFMGNGMVHGVRLEKGRATWYRNRYVRTPLLDKPDMQRVSSTGEVDRVASTANTHVVGHGGKILALEEGAYPWILDDTLETVRCENYGGKLTSPFTAHPHVCPITGEMLAFGYAQLPPYLTYLRVSPEGELVQSEVIDVPGPTMMHDFMITENYALFMDLPVIFDLPTAVKGGMPFCWSDDYGARIGIMPRTGGNKDVRWFEIEPCYVFHNMNAWEEGDEVVLDSCRISELWRQAGDMTGGEGERTLHRFRFNLKTGAVSEATLDERGMEFPRISDARVGLKNRYGYCVQLGVGEGSLQFSTHLKFDLHTGKSEEHHYGAGCNPGEPAFVGAEGCDPDSDAGYLLSYVYDDSSNKSALVVLDASRFGAEPLARIPLPCRVPYGFHGSWVAANGA